MKRLNISSDIFWGTVSFMVVVLISIIIIIIIVMNSIECIAIYVLIKLKY